jgi:hypothetical protein
MSALAVEPARQSVKTRQSVRGEIIYVIDPDKCTECVGKFEVWKGLTESLFERSKTS